MVVHNRMFKGVSVGKNSENYKGKNNKNPREQAKILKNAWQQS